MPRAYPVHAIEAKWCAAWSSARCFEAPDDPGPNKFFNFDSGPFPNGPLHLGHVRTYVLGDVTARFQRLRGKCVLYGTDWDAFGLPNESAAREASVDPREFVFANIALMRECLERLGVSYDWRRVHATCDPAYYRWTQDIFLKLFECGLVERREADSPWCPVCDSSLAAMQAEGGTCWRCGGEVAWRRQSQWFVSTSRFAERLRDGVAKLTQWSEAGRRLLRRGLTDLGVGNEGARPADWQVSRRRTWGTPIPIVHCSTCGLVPAETLPVKAPHFDAEVRTSDPRQREAAANVVCPCCGGAAPRDPETLDCFFDDSWSLLSCVANLGPEETFPPSRLAAWLPVDCFHSGFDTFGYLNLYRFIGFALHDAGLLSCDEPIGRYHGHDMVLSGGRKMSKHLGNAIDPTGVLEAHGADAMRVAILRAAGPERALDWQHAHAGGAAAWLDRVYSLVAKTADAAGLLSSGAPKPTSAAARLAGQAGASWRRIAEFIEDYRPNAAIHELELTLTRFEAFTLHRIATGRLYSADVNLLRQLLHQFALALSPFAPFLAEELVAQLGASQLAAQSPWPS